MAGTTFVERENLEHSGASSHCDHRARDVQVKTYTHLTIVSELSVDGVFQSIERDRSLMFICACV